MMDPRKLGQLLLGEWDKTKQPLKERATMLPLGQYEDGSVGRLSLSFRPPQHPLCERRL